MAKYNNILTSTAYEKVNVVLRRELGINAAIMASELISLQKYFLNKKQLSDYGFFFNTYEYFIKDTGLTRKQISNAISKLNSAGIVSTHLTYNKGKRIKWYKVDTKKYDEYLKSSDGSICMNTEPKDSYIIYNKKLAQEVGPIAAIVLSDLLTSYYNAEADGQLFEDAWFKSSQNNLAGRCGITPKTVCTKYMPILRKFNLIDVQQKGWPKTTYAKINFDVLESILDTPISTNKKVTTLKFDSNEHSVSEPERITKLLIEKAKEVSKGSVNWEFSYKLVYYIEDRLEEGYTEEDFLNIVEHMYEYYLEKNTIDKSFTFENLFTSSKVSQWLKKIKMDSDKKMKNIELEKITLSIISRLAEESKGEVTHTLDANKMHTIKQRLEEGITEEELIEHAISRYLFLKKGNYNLTRGCSWSKLFGPKCFDEIHSKRVASSYNNKSAKNKSSRDGVKSKSLTKEQVEAAKEMANLYEANGEIGYF